MHDCIDIKPKLETTLPCALFLKENENGISPPLLKSLDNLKTKYKRAPWENLFDSPQTKNQERLIEFAESRRCLIASLEKTNPLPGDNVHVSLSHTATHSVAFVLTDNQRQLLGVGVDIESKDRQIKSKVREKFTNQPEVKLNLSPIELWTIKEASFKANSRTSGGNLFQFEISEYDPDRGAGKILRDGGPANLTTFQVHFHENLFITIALAQSLST